MNCLRPGFDAGPRPYLLFVSGYLDRRAQPSAWVIDEIDEDRFKASFDYEKNEWSSST